MSIVVKKRVTAPQARGVEKRNGIPAIVEAS